MKTEYGNTASLDIQFKIDFSHCSGIVKDSFRAQSQGIEVPIIDDNAKDGGEGLFTKMHCFLSSNFYRIIKDSIFERNASW